MNEEEELGEFIGKIRTCNLNIDSTSIIVYLNSKNVGRNGDEFVMSVITKTTNDFDSFEEKWSQRLIITRKVTTYVLCFKK